MANIMDYLDWRGDLAIAVDGSARWTICCLPSLSMWF